MFYLLIFHYNIVDVLLVHAYGWLCEFDFLELDFSLSVVVVTKKPRYRIEHPLATMSKDGRFQITYFWGIMHQPSNWHWDLWECWWIAFSRYSIVPWFALTKHAGTVEVFTYQPDSWKNTLKLIKCRPEADRNYKWIGHDCFLHYLWQCKQLGTVNGEMICFCFSPV